MNIGADGVVLIQGLKATIRDLEADVARLHQALDDFGKHTDRCAVRYKWERDCICGLTAARQRTPDTATDGKAE